MRACFNCAKSKLRCDWPDDTDAAVTVTNKPICIRCSRLNLRCWVTEPAKRGPRPGSRRITKVDRVSQLEQKLESLVSLLATNGVGPPGSLSTASAETPPEGPGPVARPAPVSGPGAGPAPSPGDTSPKGAPMVLFHGIDPNPHHHSARRSPSPCELPSPQELPTFTDHVLSHEAAEHILQEYRQKFVPKFPFVPLPASWLSHQLSPHQQFLFSTIAYAVEPPSHMDRSAFHRWFRQYLGQEMVQKEQQSLELLQAILVFAAWGHYYLCSGHRGTDIIQLAIALVADLGLDLTPTTLTPKHSSRFAEPLRKAQGQHSLQEQRAALGCFYMCTVMAPILRQSATLTFTPYMSERCDRLAQIQDEPSDVYLAALVRLQALGVRWGIAFPAPEHTFGPPRVFDDTTYMAITSAIEELEVIGRGLPSSIRDDAVLWTTHAQSRIVRFTHTAIHQHVATSTTTVPNHLDQLHHINRTAALRTCLTACVGTIRSYLAIPPLDLATTCPVMTTCSLGLALLTLRYLLLALNDDPDWDAAAARAVVDAGDMIDGLCDLFKDSYLALQEDYDQRTGTEGSDLSSPGLGGVDGWGLIAGGSSCRGMQDVGTDGSEKLSRALVEMELADDKAGPAVLGYWKKLRWFRSWYLDPNFSEERPAVPETTRHDVNNNVPNSEPLPDLPEEFTDEIWAGMANPEDILRWEGTDLVSTGL